MEPRHVLVVAATRIELDAVRKRCEADSLPGLHIEWAVTGVGMVNTAMHLTQVFQQMPQVGMAVNVGIAGAFDPALANGTAVQVGTDRIAFFGAEDGDDFLPAEEMGLCAANEVVFNATLSSARLPQVSAITVNAAHGNALSIQRAAARYAPQVESMEGAAFFRVCRYFSVSAMQVRAISNRVEPRNRDAWDLSLALNNLAENMLLVLKELNDGD